ncbi:MAG: crossover junction endodeoxyribonuclease RuvC [Verrucomicrobiota bacterium]|nr:crossover junction endodeoxyribonuclease RuvC [Verrucomicrobiota bacterium]
MGKSSRQLWANYVKRGAITKVTSGQAVLNAPSQFKGTILGVDPSLRGSGFAVLQYAHGDAIRLIEASTLKLKPSISQIECLAAIGHQVEDFINQHSIDHVAIEETIYVQNFQTAQILGAARGAAITVAAMRGLPVFEYAPLRIKQAVSGTGKASKEQIARTVLSLTGLDVGKKYDASDAAAVALCHAFTWQSG